MRRTSGNLEKRDEQRVVASISTRQKKTPGGSHPSGAPNTASVTVCHPVGNMFTASFDNCRTATHIACNADAGRGRRSSAGHGPRAVKGELRHAARPKTRSSTGSHPPHERESSLGRLATRVVVVSPRDESRRCVASRRESSLCRLATRVVVVLPRDESRRCVASRRESSLCRLATRVVVVSPRDECRRGVASRLESSLCCSDWSVIVF